MEKLKSFYLDSAMKEAVVTYIDKFLEAELIKTVKARGDVTGFADAHELIFKAVKNLDNIFKEKEGRQLTNQAE